ncbi:MAG: aquaporin family protein [Planctomycetaceae bacterium]|jgi:glycerol uptake facilitator protein|nr:aquaporin family protein [Planctomycetaceae bacterium]MBT6485433.1 aquaporin family protein [Planctomycetaceae bacterium]MBT6497229.1 aquaporin family protein [Planctomycetaceae bacterium]
MYELTAEVTAEFIGTAILILLGNGVVANVLLTDTKGNGGGLIVICTGWGLAVYTAVLCVGDISGAHINPAVTIGLAVAGEFPWSSVSGFVVAQMAGAIVGGAIVYLFYKSHYDVTEDAGLKLATFCNTPAIRNVPLNFLSEAIATFVLVYAVLLMTDPTITQGSGSTEHEMKVGLGSIGALRVGLIVFAIGLSLGGTTGYAINPARDLGPRIAHAILPIRGKGDSGWSYAPIPVIGPIVGGILAALLYRAHDVLFPTV